MSGGEVVKPYKVFIGGLHIDTDNESLRGHFETLKLVVLDAVVMRDGSTRKSRGFGFVTFEDSRDLQTCIMNPHIIDGKEVEVKKAVPKEESRPVQYSTQRTKKVFVGGLSPDTTKEEIREAMETALETDKLNSTIVDVQIMTEKQSEKPRGFGFVIFNDFEQVEALCAKKYIKIKDRDVEVKKAQSQDEMRRGDVGGGSRPPRGGSGDYGYGGRGGDAYRSGSSYYKMGMGGAGDYSRMQGYDYRQYQDYMRGTGDYGMGGGMGAYGMAGGYGDRSANGYQGYGGGAGAYRYPSQGYDMSAYASMYGQSGAMGMGTYSQTPSAYGPSRGSYGGAATGAGDKDRDRQAAGRGAAGYHPYRR